MKKSLILAFALVFVLGIAGTAFAAANPFVDVPANHWAYKAVQKLYDEGIVKGTGDRHFRGQQTMTRYEMAQIVAQAIAHSDKADKETKAVIDRLQAEFADELNQLGLRVGALEKKVGSLKVSGNARFVYWTQDQGIGNGPLYNTDSNNPANKNSAFNERFRVNFDGNVNDTMTFGGVFAADNNGVMGTAAPQRINQAWIEQSFANGDVKVRLGRMAQDILITKWYGDTDGCVDGVRADIKYGEGGLLQLGYLDMTQAGGINKAAMGTNTAAAVGIVDNYAIGKAMFAQAYYPFMNNNLTLGGFWLQENKDANANGPYPDINYNLLGFGAAYRISPNWTLRGDWMQNSQSFAGNSDPNANVPYVDKPSGYVVQLNYNKGMDIPVGEVGPLNAKKAGDYRLSIQYAKNDAGLMPAIGTAQAASNPQINSTGWKAQADIALAKNVLWQNVYFFNLKQTSYTGDTQPSKPDFFRTQLQVAF